MDADEYVKWLVEVEFSGVVLTAWEVEFCELMGLRLERGEELNEKQVARLEEIYARRRN